MESSDVEAGMVDCGVGTIVWVRRRNGSWWPGKILGPDELSASHLMSPRSGTPVKLLGREDASVDWYNLEKSKRVKPFRCGEFDDCIERAEASQGMPPKKREKYARREDAILHALELEKKLIEKKYGKSGVQSNGIGACDTQMDDEKTNGPEAEAEQLNVDDKSPEVRPRLRGLQDLGMGGGFKYKLSSLAAAEHVAVDEVLNKNSLEKRKRPQQEGDIEEETLNKRRDRRRPLVQVLKSSAKLAPNIQLLQAAGDLQLVGNDGMGGVKSPGDSYDYTQILPDQVKPAAVGLSEENNTTGSNEDTETDSSGTESMMSDSSAAHSDEGEEDIEFIPKSFGRSEAAVEHESMSEDDDDSGLREDSGDSQPLQQTSNVAVSKWQLKGKRNSRRYTERKVGSSAAWQQEESVGGGIISWEESCLKGGGAYWDHDPALYHQIQFGGRIKSMLIDVDVGVQSGYQREHVPMISLMSKLNDKAIVGHPIPIETLEDASSDFILLSATAASAADDESLGGGGDLTLQPWRTARRTAKCRVPRPPHLSEDQDQYEYLADEDGKGNHRKSRKLLKKVQQQHQHQHRKTSTLSSNQKIRTLSSISGTQQQHQQQILDVVRYEDEGAMKPESSSLPTAVACIPVKLVFSRLHEELIARHQ